MGAEVDRRPLDWQAGSDPLGSEADARPLIDGGDQSGGDRIGQDVDHLGNDCFVIRQLDAARLVVRSMFSPRLRNVLVHLLRGNGPGA